MKRIALAASVAALGLVGPASAVELLTNPGFEDPDGAGPAGLGDGWGAFGAAGFNDFFGPNGHASLFPDNVGNSGGIFQTGIAGTPGVEYEFVLADTRIEANYDADVQFGLEFYAGDDSTQVGASLVSLPDPGVEVNGGVFSHTAIAPAGTVFVRPVALFFDVFSSGGQRNVFVFEASLTEVPEPMSAALLAPALALVARRRRV
ncbi:MAG: hypothetical protein AAGA57_03870 [Planctomycetota bacterium]